MANKNIVYNANDRLIVSILKDAPDGLTLAEINERVPEGTVLKPGNITSAARKGLIAPIGEREVSRMGKKTITFYGLVDAGVRTGEDGKAFNYTDSEKAILAAIAGMDNKDRFTLEDLAKAMDREKVYSGSINALVNKKGNLAKVDTVEARVPVKGGSVNVYGFVADIPEGAEVREQVSQNFLTNPLKPSIIYIDKVKKQKLLCGKSPLMGDAHVAWQWLSKVPRHG